MYPMGVHEYRDAKFSIGKPQGGRREEQGDVARIEITDGTSRRRIISVEVPLEVFAQALFGLAQQPCVYQISSDPTLWGKQRETKTISFPKTNVYTKELVKAHLEKVVIEHEIEGWKADINGCLSSQQPHDHYNVLFTRYVSIESGTSSQE